MADSRTDQIDPRTSLHRFVWSSAIGIAVSGAAFSWLVTGGTFQFFRSIPFSNFYDVQARSLLRGTWSMPASVLAIEGIRTNGRTDMYYGPVPALLRLPVLVFTHRFDGRLTEPSLLIAFLLALILASLLSWRLRGMVRGDTGVGRLEAAATAFLIVVIGVGSVLFFLGTTAQVYEEAEMWGAALALGAFYTMVGFLDRPSAGRLVATGLLTTLALLTRASVGVGPVVAIGLTGAVYLVNWMAAGAPRWQRLALRSTRASGIRVASSPGRFSAGLLAAMGVPLALYVMINEIKFDTPFSIPLNRQMISLVSAHRQAVLAANGGSLFGLKFLPTNLAQFVRPDALTATRLFPWIFFPGKAVVLGHLLYDTRDWTSSVPAGMPVLFLLAVAGVVVAFRPSRSPGRDLAHAHAHARRAEAPATPRIAALRVPLVGAAAGTVGILTIAFIAERYLADVMPLLLLGALCGWHVVIDRWGRITGKRRVVGAAVLAVLALFQLWTSFSLSLFYQRELGPVITIPQRAGLVSVQQRIDESLFGGPTPGVVFVTRLPDRATPLDLAVIGKCTGVYQFDGNAWQTVELGAGGGAFRFEVTFPHTSPGKRQPLLVTGGPTSSPEAVAVTWEGGDHYRFSYLFAGALLPRSARVWVSGPVITVTPGRLHQVQVDLGSRVQLVYVTVDGAQALWLQYLVAPPEDVRLGSAPPSISTTPFFSGRIRPLSVATPICDEIEHRRSATTRR
ncbi:MAG: hypothetical protein ABSC41_04545 [Acidimicrobiales bacterium]